MGTVEYLLARGENLIFLYIFELALNTFPEQPALIFRTFPVRIRWETYWETYLSGGTCLCSPAITSELIELGGRSTGLFMMCLRERLISPAVLMPSC